MKSGGMKKIVMNINSATMENDNITYEWAAIELGSKKCIMNLYEIKNTPTRNTKLIVAKKEFDCIDDMKDFMNANMIKCHIQQV